MALVKVYLAPDETPEDAQQLLLKAFLGQETGDMHQEQFHQPAARAVFAHMVSEHERMWDEMLKEIFLVIEEEVG